MKSLAAVLVVFVLAVISLPAQVPNLVSYQGLLTLSSGAPVANGNYDIKFELFNVPSGGSALWTETQSGIPLHSGTFTVSLGSVVTLPAIFNQTLYVQVTALSGPSISSSTTFPRTILTSTPYSISLHLPFASSSSQPDPNAVFAVGNSGSGVGILGLHDSTGGLDPGVMGQTNSTSGGAYAVEGLVTSSAPGGYSTALRGINNGTSGSGIGVWGSQEGSGWGVYGEAPSGYGVYGYSGNGTGVEAESNTGTGLYGYSTSNAGVYGVSQSSLGVYGVSDSGWGVTGVSSNGYAVVSWGKLGVAGTGDSSVQFPNDAINSQEILDEPGIAVSYMNTFFFVSAIQKNILVDSVTITVPSSGKIVVQSTGYVNDQGHVKGVSENVALNVSDNPADNPFQSGVSSFVVPDSLPTASNYRTPFSCMRVFDAPAAGTYKFYLFVYQAFGSIVNMNVAYTSLFATYYPTIYGTTPVLVTPGSATSDGVSAAGAIPNSTQYQTVDQYNLDKTRVLGQNIKALEDRISRLESALNQSKRTGFAKKSTQAH